MADDEQFSLCWNNFNTNLSAGFHESLCRGDLVDVTLAAEGQFVKAHRLVLSVCSPYFRKMFTSMPANQHAFVFLKDVSHSALKDLIQFMYCGEVNVKQDALPAFISTAEALQIKGLTDSDPAPPPVQSPTKPPTPAPQQIPSVQTSPRVKQQRISTSRSYKIETIEDSGDDNNKHTQIVLQTTSTPQHIQVQQTQPQQHQALIHQQTTTSSQKRPSQRSISAPQSKRLKNTVDPLEAVESNQITVQTVSEGKSSTSDHQEIIEFPIDIPTKSEPDYTEDATEVEDGGEQETTYVEEDSYGEMKYDESYFTENDDGNQSATTGATTSGIKQQNTFSDSYVDAADQSATEAQVLNKKPRRGRPKGTGKVKPKSLPELMDEALLRPSLSAVYTSTTQGGMKIVYDGHHFKFIFRKGPNSIFQCCWNENNEQCKVRALVNQKRVYHLDGKHTHYGRAVDKSSTSIVTIDSPSLDTTVLSQTKDIANKNETPKAKYEDHKIVLLNAIPQTKNDNESDDFMAPEDFKERIKKRLQKALLGKKKA